VAYQSDESGKGEVYVRSFPDVNKGKWQVSSSGGGSPLRSPDGRELFYRSGDATMAVEAATEPTFKRGNPKIILCLCFTGGCTKPSQYQSVAHDAAAQKDQGDHELLFRSAHRKTPYRRPPSLRTHSYSLGYSTKTDFPRAQSRSVCGQLVYTILGSHKSFENLRQLVVLVRLLSNNRCVTRKFRLVGVVRMATPPPEARMPGLLHTAVRPQRRITARTTPRHRPHGLNRKTVAAISREFQQPV